MPNIEKHRALGKKFFAEQDRLRGGPAPELCTSTYSARLNGNPPMDRAGHEQFARAWYAAFSDSRHEVETVIVEGNTAVVRFVIHGTHTGDFFGIPATKKPVIVAAHVILEIENDKVAKLTAIFDQAGMLRQIGVLPGS